LIKNYFYIFFVLISTYGYAQNSSVFESITTKDGLPSNYVFCVEEDSHGYMWVGTDKGLCRFNGATWEVWDTDSGLPGNYISYIKKDEQHGLWLAIAEKGIYHYNCVTKKVVFIKKGISSSLATNKNGELLISVYEKDRPQQYLVAHNNTVRELPFSKNLFFFNNDYAYHNDTTKKVTTILHFGKTSSIDSSYIVFKKNIQAYTIPYRINQTKETITATKHFIIGDFFILNTSMPYGNNALVMQNLFKHSNKQLVYTQDFLHTYIGKLGEGFYAIDNKTNTTTQYNEANGLTSLNVNHLYSGKDGNIYISTLGGGINILPLYRRNHFDLPEMPIKNLQLITHAYTGLANGIIYTFDKEKINSALFTVKDALSFYKENNQLLVGSFSGVHFFDLQKGKAILQKTLPLTAGISTILPYYNNWLLSTYGGGFYTCTNTQLTKVPATYPFSNIEKTIKLSNGFAALSYEQGFFTVDKNLQTPNAFTTQNGLLSNYITDVLEFKDSLWVGGKKGISIIVNNKVVKTLSAANGFKGTKVIKVFALQKEVLYIVSDAYIHIYIDGALKAISSEQVTADKTDKIYGTIYNDDKQELVISTNKRLSVVNLFTLMPKQTAVDISISEIKVDNQFITDTTNFTVAYNRNNLFFKLQPLVGTFFNRTKLFYKLNNNNWYAVSDSLTINFTQLRSGSYDLYIKSSNADGLESTPVKISSFTINKPWWQQTWFILLAILMAIFLIYQLIQYFSKRKYTKKLQALKLQEELETERQRISRDLHDNMGAYTSALIANVQQLKAKTGETAETYRMQMNAEQILESLRETIWVLNNKEISIQAFSDGFKNYCFKVLKNFEQVNFTANETIQNNKKLSANEAIHLNKILQELVQNIIKHAAAKQIIFTLLDAPVVSLSITDNGIGFDESTTKRNNGLDNIEWRVKEINYTVQIDSIIGKGTTVIIMETGNVV
jgi:signal transduction histidine kinase